MNCAGLTCCETWSELSRAYNEGRRLEAALEAARRIGTKEDAPWCRFRRRIVEQMHGEGWLAFHADGGAHALET